MKHQPSHPDRQPDRRPRTAPAAERHIGRAAAAGGQHPTQERPDRRVGGEAQLLRRHRVGSAGRELRPVPGQRPAGSRRRAPRVARVHDPGRPEAPGGRGDRRERAVPRLTRAERQRGGSRRRADRRRAERHRRLRHTRAGRAGQRRRHPVLSATGAEPMSERSHRRLTPRQRHLLRVVRSFGPSGATARQIQLRAIRTRGRPGTRRRG